MRLRIVALLLSLIATVQPSFAQGVDGYVSLMGDAFPTLRASNGEERATAELRVRVFVERRFDVGDRLRLTAAGFADGLVANRRPVDVSAAGIVRPQELHLQATWDHADVRVGMSRVVWGRLDEFLPTDVVNPQDLSRFFLEGRTEGRMPVAMVRARWLPSDRFALEGIYVPIFRRGSFDQLDEDTSPFNLLPQTQVTIVSNPPSRTFNHAQGGARASLTSGRVDWSVAAYRGFEPLPLYEFSGTTLTEQFPRFTMLGGDFETVRGQWGVRGEIAGFTERTFQSLNAPITGKGQALEAGLGVDRKAGQFRVSGNLVLAKRWADALEIDRTDVTVVAAVDRSFARETRTVRVFGVYNPSEESAFGRVIASFSLRDNVSLEASAGVFTGDGRDVLSLFESRDFVYARLKVFF